MKAVWRKELRSKLNEDLWMRCVKSSMNNQLYGIPDFLDAVAPQWHCWVWGEYEAVLPIPVRSKMGIEYIFQPEFYQRTQIYSLKPLDECKVSVSDVLHQYLSIDLTYLGDKINLAKPLLNLYLPVKSGILLSQNTKRNLKKFNDLGLQVCVVDNPDETEVFEHFKHHTRFALNPYFKETFSRVFNFLSSSHHLKVYSIAQNLNLGFAVVSTAGNRNTLLLLSTSKYGKTIGVSRALVLTAIEESHNTQKDFDFEGSNHSGIARFYKSFGALEEPYWHVKKGLFKRL